MRTTLETTHRAAVIYTETTHCVALIAHNDALRRLSPPPTRTTPTAGPPPGLHAKIPNLADRHQTMRNQQTTIAIAIALLLALGIWATTGTDEPGPTPLATSNTAPSSEPPADAPPPDPTSIPPAPQRSSLPAAPPWLSELLPEEAEPEPPLTPLGAITGRLAWKDGGLPVPNARVSLQRSPRDTVIPEPGEAPPQTDPLTSTSTDRNGNFTLDWVPHRETLFLRFELDDGTVEIADVRSLPELNTRTWQGEYLLDARGTIQGQVVDADGEPLSGVHIRAVDELRFDDPDVPTRVREARIRGAETYDRERVVDSRLDVLQQRQRQALLPYPTGQSDADGTFSIRGVREGIVNLLVQHEHAVSRRVELPVVGNRTTDAGVIALGVGVEMRVRLLDEDLAPLSGIDVAFRPVGWRFAPPPVKTNSDGFASCRLDVQGTDPLAEGLKVRVSARRSPGKPFGPLGLVEPPGATWVLSSRSSFDVRLVTSDGSQIEHLQLGTRPATRGMSWRHLGDTVQVQGIPPESTPLLFAIANGYAPSFMRVLTTPHFPAQLPLEPDETDLDRVRALVREDRPTLLMSFVPTFGARIRVVDEFTQPVAGARITFSVPHPGATPDSTPPIVNGWSLGVTDENGMLEAKGLWDTSLAITAWHSQRGRVEQQFESVERDQLIELALPSPAMITGIVVDRGQPVTRRYRVALVGPSGPPPFAQRYEGAACTTDDAGRFAIPRVSHWPWRDQRWLLKVEDPLAPDAGEAFHSPHLESTREYYRQQISLVPGGRFDMTLELSDSRKRTYARGEVRINGASVPGARVELWDLGRESRNDEPVYGSATRTDSMGAFEFSHPGFMIRTPELRASIERHGRSVELARHKLTIDMTKRNYGPIIMDIAFGGIVLILRDSTGQPLSNRPATLIMTTGPALPVLTDEHGTVREDALPVGSYRIRSIDRFGAPLEFEPEITVTAGGSGFEMRDAAPR